MKPHALWKGTPPSPKICQESAPVQLVRFLRVRRKAAEFKPQNGGYPVGNQLVRSLCPGFLGSRLRGDRTPGELLRAPWAEGPALTSFNCSRASQTQ